MKKGSKPGEHRGGRRKGTPNKVPSIKDLRAMAAENYGVDAKRVIQELARIAFADQRKVMTWGPGGVRLIDSAELSDADAAIVGEVSETVTKEGGSIKLRVHDKIAALDKLGRFLNLFEDKAEQGKNAGATITVVVRSVLDPP